MTWFCLSRRLQANLYAIKFVITRWSVSTLTLGYTIAARSLWEGLDSSFLANKTVDWGPNKQTPSAGRRLDNLGSPVSTLIMLLHFLIKLGAGLTTDTVLISMKRSTYLASPVFFIFAQSSCWGENSMISLTNSSRRGRYHALFLMRLTRRWYALQPPIELQFIISLEYGFPSQLWRSFQATWKVSQGSIHACLGLSKTGKYKRIDESSQYEWNLLQGSCTTQSETKFTFLRLSHTMPRRKLATQVYCGLHTVCVSSRRRRHINDTPGSMKATQELFLPAPTGKQRTFVNDWKPPGSKAWTIIILIGMILKTSWNGFRQERHEWSSPQ